MATISKSSTFEAPKFSENFFSPWFRWVLPVAWPRAAASRGATPLHWAANNGHDSVAERLLEAKAGVDAQDDKCRGLGGGYWGGKSHETWDSVVRK